MIVANSPSEKRREKGLVHSEMYSCMGVCGASVGCDEEFESVQAVHSRRAKSNNVNVSGFIRKSTVNFLV